MESLIVIKIGGNVLDEEARLTQVLNDFSLVAGNKILVHGGGKIASRIGEAMGLKPRYVDGRRITDDQTLDLVTMVYGGLVNRRIVARLQALACNALGLTGADGDCLRASKRPKGQTDYGWAGDIDLKVQDPSHCRNFLEQGWVPVFAPLTHDGAGHLLNTNADTIASSLAILMSPYYNTRLLYCFEKKGVLRNSLDEQTLIPDLTTDQYERLKAEGCLADGILPKLENAFFACRSGVQEVLIGDSRDLLAHCSGFSPGTRIHL